MESKRLHFHALLLFSIDVLPDERFRPVIGFGMIHIIIAKMSITESLT